MTLTPIDIENSRFRPAFRGLNRQDVEQFLARAAEALEEQYAQAAQLKARVTELERQLGNYRESEELLKNSVVLAQRTCDELIAAAHERADVIRMQALAEGDDIRRDLSALKSEREQFEYAFHGLLSGFLHRLEAGNSALAAPRQPAPASLPQATPPTASAPAAQYETVQSGGEEIEILEDARQIRQPRPAAPPVPPIPTVPVPSVPDVPLAHGHRPAGDRDNDIGSFEAALAQARPVPPAPSAPAQRAPLLAEAPEHNEMEQDISTSEDGRTSSVQEDVAIIRGGLTAAEPEGAGSIADDPAPPELGRLPLE